MKNSQLSNILLKVGCFFLAQKFVLSNIIRIFAAREPAKPLNDAQMCGSFFYMYLWQTRQYSIKLISHQKSQ